MESPPVQPNSALSAPRRPTAALESALALLGTGTPADVLARLATGDPLGFERRAAARARIRCILVDPAGATARAQAVAAFRATYYRGRPALEQWLEACVDAALDQIIGEQEPSAIAGLDGAALVRFHQLPFATREVFCRVMLDGEDLGELARSRGSSVSELGRLARRAIDTLADDDGAARAGGVR